MTRHSFALHAYDLVVDQDELLLRATIRGYIYRFHLAVQLESERTLKSGSDEHRQVDSHLFAVALKDLRASVEWGGNKCCGEGVGVLRKALAAFDAAVPDAKNVRDVHEHFVNYESGDPKRFLKHIDPDYAVFWSIDGAGNVEVSIAGYKLDVGIATTAADAMATAALEALSV